MNKKNNIHKTLFTFIPVSIIVGTLIFTPSNVKDIKPVHADSSNYSLTIEGGSTISFDKLSDTTYEAYINENVRRNTRITFYDSANEMTYSDTCYADYLDTTNNLYNGAQDLDANGGYFYTKYGISKATVTLSINNGVKTFYMSGAPSSLKISSYIPAPTTTLKEGSLYCFGTSATYLVSSYDESGKYFKTSSSDQPFIFTVKENNGRWTFKLLSTNNYLYSPSKKNMAFSDDPISTFTFSSSGRLVDNNNLALCNSNSSSNILFQSYSVGYVATSIYELKEISSVKAIDSSYTFDCNQTKEVNLVDTIHVVTVVDDCELGSSIEGFTYQIIYDDKHIASLSDTTVTVSDKGAFTVKMTHIDTGAILYAPFVFYDGNIIYTSPLTIVPEHDLSNLSEDSILHSNYDYTNKFGFVSSSFDKYNDTYLGTESGKDFKLFNVIPLGEINAGIRKIEINGDMVSTLECIFSNDPEFTTYVKGDKSSVSLLADLTFIPSDGNTYTYFQLTAKGLSDLPFQVYMDNISIYFGEDKAASYASSFNDDFCAICELVISGDKGLVDIINEWNIQKEIFIILKEESLDAANRLKNATYTDENIDIAEFALKYDYIYGKYHSSLDDYIGRNPVKLSQGKNVYHYLSESEDQSILIIVISGTVLLLVSAASLLILLKKKKKQ